MIFYTDNTFMVAGQYVTGSILRYKPIHINIMNKKVMSFLLAIPALMGFGLTSCSDESSLAVKETTQDKLVNVTLTAQISDQTRASFDPEKNVLKFKWELNDEIQVVNAANGKFLGKLTVSKIQESDPRVCSFAGSCNIPAGKVKLNFYYLGKGGKATYNMDFTLQDYLVDFSAQDGMANFADNDILMSVREFQDVQDGNLGKINFDRDFAYGRFILKYNGEELNLDGKSVTISANSGKLYNKATLNFQNAAYAPEEGTITVTPKTNDFYVSFFPTEAVNLKFAVDEFDGTKGEKLVANIYYTADTEGEPIVVEMRHSDGSDDKHDFTLVFEDGEGQQLNSKSLKELDNTTVTIADYSADAEKGLVEGRTFLGWAEKSEATSVKTTVTFTTDNAVITLVPVYKMYTWLWKWTDDPADNVGNGSYGASRESGYGPTKKLVSAFPCDNSNNTQFYQSNKKDGYTFSHWEYEGKKVTNNDDLYADVVEGQDPIEVYIYAKWKKNPVTYSLHYIQNLNGSDISADELPEPTTADKYEIELPEPKDFLNNAMSSTILPGYTFLYWTTDREGKGQKYYKEDIFTLTSENPTATLYGQWKKDASSGHITAPGAEGSDY